MILFAVLLSGAARFASADSKDYIWIEGEKPSRASVTRHPWWYDRVQRDKLSGGDFITNWSDKKPGEVEYDFVAPAAGLYEFWVRANPVGTSLSYHIDGSGWIPIDMKSNVVDSINIAENNALDIRFIAWIKVGRVSLRRGANTVAFLMNSANNNHGAIDCMIFSRKPFEPHGILKPGEVAAEVQKSIAAAKGWFAFDPPQDDFADSPIDLRSLNEKAAGDGGFIGVKGGRFVHTSTGEPLRFWAINGPPDEVNDSQSLQHLARMLAKRGVNQIRIHAEYFDQDGNIDLARVKRAQAVVAAMKSAGIYTDFSTYYVLFLHPGPGTSWLPGYDGTQNPFAALFFYPPLQEKYRSWWKGLLLTPDASGHRLIDDPAVSSLEMCNEDSYFFWTFGADHLPDPELHVLETQFGDWLKAKYGTLPLALAHWHHLRIERDDPDEGRMAFRPLWDMFNDRTIRDQDTATFLVESERKFYSDTYAFLRSIGFKGVITASNWITASPKFFDPLERYAYTAGDYLDRHGYFDCDEKGDAFEWSMRNGHTFADRDALRFDPAEPGKPPAFSNPVMSIHFDEKPSTISETMFNRPNRYRSEMPLYDACYGALQGNDGTIFFALDGSTWRVKPGYFMQPWTVMTPGIMGQFPAAALIYRKGLVRTPPPVASVNLKLADLLQLQGTPLPQTVGGDETDCIDPLVHYVGPTTVRFTAEGGPTRTAELNNFIDRSNSTVRSINGDLSLDFGNGVMTIRAPSAQGASGALAAAGNIDLPDVGISSPLQLGNIVVTALDGKPIKESSRMLLQVMSEERPADFQTEAAGDGLLRIVNIGHDPWLVKELSGEVHFKRPDAAGLRATPLDFNGVPSGSPQPAADLHLDPHTVYYLIEAPE